MLETVTGCFNPMIPIVVGDPIEQAAKTRCSARIRSRARLKQKMRPDAAMLKQ
jgi:hypothetical protein